MNLDNDYDTDGNNIVPCPICLNVFCPSKEGGKCPEEDEYAKAMNTPANEWREFREEILTFFTGTPHDIDRTAEIQFEDMFKRHQTLISAHLVGRYNELLLAVGKKHAGETRHETALRYIKNAEKPSDEATEIVESI